MTRRPGESRSRRAGGTLAVFFLGSIAVHAAVLVALPEFGHERALPKTAALEVVLLRAELPPEPAPARASPEPRTERQAPPATSPEPRMAEGAAVTVESAKVPEPMLAAPEQQPTGAGEAVTPASVTAAYLRNPAPGYPLASRRAGEQGMVTLRVRVARDGSAASVAVERSSGSPHLDAAALEAVKAWRFTPARRGAEAVDSWMLVPVVFRLEGSS